MITLTVRERGREFHYEVPVAVQELTYGQYLDFRKCEERYFDAGAEDRPLQEAEAFLNEALAYVIRGDISRLPLTLPEDDPEQVLQSGFRFDRLSRMRLYGHVLYLLQGFEPDAAPIDKAFRVEYAGEVFFVEPEEARRFMVGDKRYSLGEVAQVEESDRLLSEQIEKQGDPDGALAFERELRAMAVLLRREGEALPVHPGERTAFIEERMRFFEDLPMDVVLSVRFFFQRTCQEFRRILITRFFSRVNLNSLLHATAREESRKQPKAPPAKR